MPRPSRASSLSCSGPSPDIFFHQLWNDRSIYHDCGAVSINQPPEQTMHIADVMIHIRASLIPRQAPRRVP